jgi:hypothetical protein
MSSFSLSIISILLDSTLFMISSLFISSFLERFEIDPVTPERFTDNQPPHLISDMLASIELSRLSVTQLSMYAVAFGLQVYT